MDLLHRKAQSYKFRIKMTFFCAWRDFNKTFCGISLYHKWMLKLQISSIFHFDRAHLSWISGLLGVKSNQIMVVAFQPVQLTVRFLTSVIMTSSNFESGQILRKAMCSILADVIMSSEVSREDYLQFALKKAVI